MMKLFERELKRKTVGADKSEETPLEAINKRFPLNVLNRIKPASETEQLLSRTGSVSIYTKVRSVIAQFIELV